MAPKDSLGAIKENLDRFIGEKIVLKANGGRKRIIERVGVLEETYPSVFIIKLDEENHAFERVSYSYADILTSTVELTIFKDDEKFLINSNCI
jgi:uncharacterized protein Veg